MERRRWLQWLVASGIAPMLMRQALARGEVPIQPGLRKLTGQVRVNGQDANAGMIIKAGDTVTTGPDGQAIYVIGQDAFLQRAGTEVRFPMTTEAFLRLVSGRLLSVFGHGEKRLLLPTATIGIRGTACYAEAAADKTYFCLCYGTADVVPLAAPQQQTTVRTRHHEHPLYIHDDPGMPTTMVPAEVINHSDAELELLESLVGRVPPFVGQKFKAY